MGIEMASATPLAKRSLVASIIGVIAALTFALGVMVGSWYLGKPQPKTWTQNEQLVLWLARMPAVINPPLPPQERMFYGSWDEWKAAGLKIPDVENEILARLEIGNSVFPPVVYVIALGHVGGDRSVNALITILGAPDSDAGTFRAAIGSLGAFRSSRSVEPLCKLALSTKDHDTLLSIIEALGSIGDSRARPTIEELLRTGEFPAGEKSLVENILAKLSAK